LKQAKSIFLNGLGLGLEKHVIHRTSIIIRMRLFFEQKYISKNTVNQY